ncbi:MAG TPA: PhnD/SsuA/transferrin family substrate-binding protein [Labilithrix sp.]|jgi:phosphonate transport system substrate-binding protein
MGDAARIVFGLVPPPSFAAAEPGVARVLRYVSERADVMMVRRHVDTYEALARALRHGEIDVAWLPPIPFARLSGDGLVHELVCGERAGRETFCAVLIARADSKIGTRRELVGKRVAWVDPLSATGYVVPRLRLASHGIDPTTSFTKESFYGSHPAVVRAVLDRQADIGATYAGFGDRGELVRGSFLDVGASADDLLVVDAYGDIPPDVVAVRAAVDPQVALRVAKALLEADGDALDAIRAVFGVVRFVQEPLTGYDTLRAEVEHGVDSGVIPAAAAFLSTRPPPPGELT